MNVGDKGKTNYTMGIGFTILRGEKKIWYETYEYVVFYKIYVVLLYAGVLHNCDIISLMNEHSV